MERFDLLRVICLPANSRKGHILESSHSTLYVSAGAGSTYDFDHNPVTLASCQLESKSCSICPLKTITLTGGIAGR